MVRDAADRLTLVRDPLRMLVFLLTVVSISRVHLHYPILAKLRPVLLLTALAWGYAFLNPRALTRANVFASLPMRLVITIAAIGVIGAPFGISLGNSGLFILDVFSKTIAYALLIALSVRHVRDLYTAVWAFVISCAILAFFAVFVFQLLPGDNDTSRLAELYTYDSNDLGVVLMIGLPLTLLLLFVDHGIKRWVLVATLIGVSAAMARSGSRGGFLGFIAVSLASLFFVKSVSAGKRATVLIVAAVVLAFAAPAGYWRQMGTIISLKSDYNFKSVDGRQALIQRGVRYMIDRPLFGIGIWNFAKAECSISPKISRLSSKEAVKCVAPHNSFLQAGAELGVPGLIVWVTLVLSLIVGPLRLRRRLPSWWRVGNPTERFLYAAMSLFPVAMCGFAVTAFFVTFAFGDPLYVMAALTTALYGATRAYVRESANNPRPPAPMPSGRNAPGWRVSSSTERFIAAAADRLGEP
jgi:O-antigen ligase